MWLFMFFNTYSKCDFSCFSTQRKMWLSCFTTSRQNVTFHAFQHKGKMWLSCFSTYRQNMTFHAFQHGGKMWLFMLFNTQAKCDFSCFSTRRQNVTFYAFQHPGKMWQCSRGWGEGSSAGCITLQTGDFLDCLNNFGTLFGSLWQAVQPVKPALGCITLQTGAHPRNRICCLTIFWDFLICHKRIPITQAVSPAKTCTTCILHGAYYTPYSVIPWQTDADLLNTYICITQYSL